MGRGRVYVRYNHIPAVRRAIPRELSAGVDEFSEHLEIQLKARVWRRTGVVADTIQDRDPSKLHATISVGLRESRGFYSRFNEWGTVKQAARPVVGPVAHENEPVFVAIMMKHVQKACEAQ